MHELVFTGEICMTHHTEHCKNKYHLFRTYFYWVFYQNIFFKFCRDHFFIHQLKTFDFNLQSNLFICILLNQRFLASFMIFFYEK